MPAGIINQVIPDFLYFCDALRDLVPLIQFKKREKKKRWRNATFSKLAGSSLRLY